MSQQCVCFCADHVVTCDLLKNYNILYLFFYHSGTKLFLFTLYKMKTLEKVYENK